MDSGSGATFRWLGAAHHHISHKDLKIIIDPLYTRLPGDKPHLADIARAPQEAVIEQAR